MLQFQNKILMEVKKLEDQANLVHESLENNLWNSNSRQGILRRSYEQYASCLKVDLNTLKQLIASDTEDWCYELEMTKKRIEEIKEQTTKLAKKKQSQIERLMSEMHDILLNPNIQA